VTEADRSTRPTPGSPPSSRPGGAAISGRRACCPATGITARILRYFEDLTEKDTAAALGCSVGAVKSTHARALAKLRETTGNRTILG
jgi:hypothetical protein